MKKTGFLIMAALSIAVLVFSATVFADQSGLLKNKEELSPVSRGEKVQTETKEESEPKLVHGTGAYLENGIFRFYRNGILQKETGVAFCPEDGLYRYVENGIFAAKTGVATRLTDGKPVYVNMGLFASSTGAAKRLSDGTLIYVKNGVFKKTTDVVKRLNSKRYVYVQNGVFKKKTGLVQKKNKRWVLLKKGVLVTNPKKFFLTKVDKKAGRSEILCEVFARAVYKKAVKTKMSKEQKLRACFNYLTPEKHFHYLMTRIPYYTAPDSTIVYTLDMMREGGSTCHGFGSLFAYLARLCGYKNSYYCWSAYHGWAEVNGLIYDPVFLGEPHNTEVFATPYDVGREMGLGTDYYEINRYKIPKFK